MKYWGLKDQSKHLYPFLWIKQAPVNWEVKFVKTFLQQKKLWDSRARAGAGATILTIWSRGRVKMEQLHNTTSLTATQQYSSTMKAANDWECIKIAREKQGEKF